MLEWTRRGVVDVRVCHANPGRSTQIEPTITPRRKLTAAKLTGPLRTYSHSIVPGGFGGEPPQPGFRSQLIFVAPRHLNPAARKRQVPLEDEPTLTAGKQMPPVLTSMLRVVKDPLSGCPAV
jgi:hypothetical protein